MTSVSKILARNPPKTFKVFYSPGYDTFILHRVLTDPQHPLHELRKREHEKRKKDGLWWHVTSSVNLAKSSVVRNKCRRKLRNAFIDALKERGFDEYGLPVQPEALDGTQNGTLSGPSNRNYLALKGSVRFHILPSCIPAKYQEVQHDVAKVAEILLQGANAELQKTVVPRKSQRNAHTSPTSSATRKRSGHARTEG